MAYDYNKIKQQYEALSPEQQKQFAEMNKNDTSGNYQKFMQQYNAEKAQASTPTQTVQNTQTQRTTTQNNGLNSMSQTAAQANSRDFQVGTGDVAEMPQQQTQGLISPARADRLAKSWNNLTYEQQQERLNRTAGLKDALAQRGITSKTQPTQTTTPAQTTQKTTQPQTPKQEQWDYQDNSQARMDQIANNLNGYRQTMPQLFDDMSAFYNFFIKDKGRSQDQIDFLWDYYNRVQKYGKYDNLSPEQIGTGIANGTIPEDYLNTLKSTDPQKYQEVMAAKQNREDAIKNESFLNDAATMAGMEGWESEPSSIQYAKRNQIWMDEDNNGIDDRREHYASEEEQGYQKQIADLNAANLDIDNTVKHTYEDLVKAYPGATKATLMAMAQDRNADLLREKENNLVELTRLQGYVGYMQQERFEMNQAGADSIAQLQKNLGMYYQYSPEGIAELAQAQYGATNITLDQADSGNETQKQMALQSVLDDYYAKYGSIIQRSEQQVINDVIALSKKEGISLAEAFEKNFMSQLRSKPQFATLSSGGTLGTTDKWKEIKAKDASGNDITLKINEATGETLNLDGTPYTGKIQTTTTGGASFTPVSYSKMYSESSKLQEEYPEGSSYKNGWCGELGNLYLERIGSDIRFGDDVSTKTKWITNDDPNSTPAVGSIVVWDYSNNPNVAKVARDSGHVAIVTNVNSDGSFDVYEQNGDGKHQVGYRTIKNRNYIAGFIDPADTTGLTAGGAGGNGDISDVTYEVSSLAWIPTQLRNTDVEKQWYLDILGKMKESGLNAFDAAMSLIGFTVTNKSAEAQNVKNKILNAVRMAGSEDVFDGPSMQNMANAINSGDYELALQTLENKVNNFMSSKGLTDALSTRIQPAMTTIDTLRGIDVPGWKSGTVETALKEGKLQGITSTQILSLRADLRKKLRDLGYDVDELEDILPNLNDTKENFIQKLNDIESSALLDTMNSWRRLYGLPDITTNVILGREGLSSLYKISNSDQLLDMISKGKSFSNLLR